MGYIPHSSLHRSTSATHPPVPGSVCSSAPARVRRPSHTSPFALTAAPRKPTAAIGRALTSRRPMSPACRPAHFPGQHFELIGEFGTCRMSPMSPRVLGAPELGRSEGGPVFTICRNMSQHVAKCGFGLKALNRFANSPHVACRRCRKYPAVHTLRPQDLSASRLHANTLPRTGNSAFTRGILPCPAACRPCAFARGPLPRRPALAPGLHHRRGPSDALYM
jgi:hypothetical protein